MGQDLVEHFPDIAGATYERADEILGFSISALCFQGPEEKLTATQNTQPALFVTCVAILRVLISLGIRPAATAGHSVGEYAALVAADAVEFEQALGVVRRRGELMAQAVELTPGAMAAVIGLSIQEVVEVCKVTSAVGVVEPSNINAPNQIVVSGEVDAIQAAMQEVQHRGARAIKLNVSAPFHCSLMEPVRARLEPELRALSITEPSIEVVANATGEYVRTPQEIRQALLDQLAAPVLWTQSMQRLIADGYTEFIEAGPGRVLAGLMRSVDRSASVRSAGTADDVAKVVGTFK